MVSISVEHLLIQNHCAERHVEGFKSIDSHIDTPHLIFPQKLSQITHNVNENVLYERITSMQYHIRSVKVLVSEEY